MKILNRLGNPKVIAIIFVIGLIFNLANRFVPASYWLFLNYKFNSIENACIDDVCIKPTEGVAIVPRVSSINNNQYFVVAYLVDTILVDIIIDSWAPEPDRLGVTLLDDGVIEFGMNRFRRYAMRLRPDHEVGPLLLLVDEEMKVAISLSDQELLLPRTQEILASLEITREKPSSIVLNSQL